MQFEDIEGNVGGVGAGFEWGWGWGDLVLSVAGKFFAGGV